MRAVFTEPKGRIRNRGHLPVRFALAIVITTLSLFISAVGSASTIDVAHSFVTIEDEGEVVRGTLEIRFANLGAEELRNVDLRLVDAGGNWIDKGVLQLGSVAAGEVAIASSGYLFQTDTFLAAGEAGLAWTGRLGSRDGVGRRFGRDPRREVGRA